jgi:hypothetical protein
VILLEGDFNRISEHGITKIISSRRSFGHERISSFFFLFEMHTSVQCFGIIKIGKEKEKERKKKKKEREKNRCVCVCSLNDRENDCPFYLTPCPRNRKKKKIIGTTSIKYNVIIVMYFYSFSWFTRCF